MNPPSRRLALWSTIGALVLAYGIAPAGQQRETRERHVMVSVLDRNETPVKDLTIRDFTVRENGASREVTRVTPGAGPSDIALAVDTSQAIQDLVSDLRTALKNFVSQVHAARPDTPISLTQFGDRPEHLVDYSRSSAPVVQRIDRLFPMSGGGSYLLDALLEIGATAKKRELKQPAVVVFASEDSPEFSNVLHDRVVDALKGARMSLWTVVLHRRGAGVDPTSTEERERGMVLIDVARDSGGMNKPVLDKSGLDAAFKSVATALTSQYDVTYGRPESLIPPDRLEVTVNRRDVRVAAPRWTGQ